MRERLTLSPPCLAFISSMQPHTSYSCIYIYEASSSVHIGKLGKGYYPQSCHGKYLENLYMLINIFHLTEKLCLTVFASFKRAKYC